MPRRLIPHSLSADHTEPCRAAQTSVALFSTTTSYQEKFCSALVKEQQKVGCRLQSQAASTCVVQARSGMGLPCAAQMPGLPLLNLMLSFSRVTGGSITAVGLTDVVRALSHCLQLEEIK